jgi:hypothetical protein
MKIGLIDGNHVTYDIKEKSVSCKDLKCLAKDIIDGYESNLDRLIIPSTSKKDLIMKKHPDGITLGCFELGLEHSKLLIYKLKRCVKKN